MLFRSHLAYEVDDIYATCDQLMKAGITINRPPRDGNMAFVRSPDHISVEILQKGSPLPPGGQAACRAVSMTSGSEKYQEILHTGPWCCPESMQEKGLTFCLGGGPREMRGF